jgi:hypothetical protein
MVTMAHAGPETPPKPLRYLQAAASLIVLGVVVWAVVGDAPLEAKLGAIALWLVAYSSFLTRRVLRDS